MTQASGRTEQPTQPAGAAPSRPDAEALTALAFEPRAHEAFLVAISAYLDADEQRQIQATLTLCESAFATATDTAAPAPAAQATSAALRRRLGDALGTASILAEDLRFDVVTLAAVLLEPLLDTHALTPAALAQALEADLGERVARAVGGIERFDALQRPGATLRLAAQVEQATQAEAEPPERRKGRERRRAQDEDALRKMFLGVAEDPRVVIVKVADHLRLLREAAAQATRLRQRQDTALDLAETADAVEAESGAGGAEALTLDQIRALAEETRALYAPLAARLGMGRVDGDLEDLAFAILEPDDYRWLQEAVAEETSERSAYVDRVCRVLAEEVRKIGIEAEVSGRVKHLYSIYRKVVRSGNRDLSQLYDILAFRVITGSVADCYLALGHVHDLWRPVDGRIKDFIANPKANGYQSLHTTVFCLENRLAEIQIRTHEMHETAEYGVAMHWYYKDVGDGARADARALQQWMQQVMEWRQELKDASKAHAAEPTPPAPPLQEQIFVFTPKGDVKELPAGATPLDFAYRVHTDLGNHVGGVRITQNSESGRPVKKLVPLDYELRNGDIIELMKRNDAHPTRDWLRIVRTKLARTRILHYLKTHERDIDIQVGRERLDLALRTAGVRKGYDELTEEDLKWMLDELKLSDEETLLAMVGADKLRVVVVVNKARERLKLIAPVAEPEPEQIPVAPPRELQNEISVTGMAGILTQIASCCHPLPGDALCGYISRGRGVVIHREDCPNLRRLLEQSPERGIAVEWPKLDGQQAFRAPIVVEGGDRTGLLRDVTGVIASHKLNMVKVDVSTNQRTHKATINAILEINRPEQLEAVVRDIAAIDGVLSVGRKAPASARERGQ